MKSIIKIYKVIENFWFDKINEKLRFLLVGGFNTVISYAIFFALVEIFKIYYNYSLVIQFVITVNISIATMRYYVFHKVSGFWIDYVRGWTSYGVMFLINAPALNVLIIFGHIKPVVAQALYLVISTIMTFFIHKYFSFRKANIKNIDDNNK
ncbi:MAG: GtrA family protein [Alphaproteobacteria bacterium]|nr:GtrA family protein [Alphaproteobacteria bacterium]